MNTVLPISIILGLGGLAGLILHRRGRSPWITSVIAAVIATLAWVGGVYLLFWVTVAPNEIGPPLLEPVLLTFGTAFVPALLVGYAMRLRSRGEWNRDQALSMGHAPLKCAVRRDAEEGAHR